MIAAAEARQPCPRLRTGIRWYLGAEGLVVRSATGSFTVPAGLRGVAERLLPSLDGRRELGELASGGTTADGLGAIAFIAALADLNLLADGPDRPPQGRSPDLALLAAHVVVQGDGLLAAAIRDHLVTPATGTANAGAPLHLLALDGPDLSALHAENRAAHAAGRDWMPVFPFGDRLVVGPLIRPGETACLRCFELRWLGMSPSIALERGYLDSLRHGATQDELLNADAAARLAGRIAPLLARAAAGRAPATLWLLSADGDEAHEARLERHPLCEVCGGAPRTRADEAAAWRQPATDLREVLGAISPLVDRYVGIAVDLPGASRRADPQLGLPAISLSRYAAPQPGVVTERQSNLAHGSADSAESACTVALIEAIERYCGLFPPRADVIARFAELGGEALPPTELPLFSAAQYSRPGFAYRPFTPDMLLGWAWGWNVSRGRRVLVPSAAVWYGAEDQLVGETSNGVAAHSSRGHALANGALELIERDAFMLHWLHRISPPRIDRAQLRGNTAQLAAAVEGAGYDVVLADLTSDLGVPVVLALGVHELGMRPALLVGAGASLDAGAALRHALRELYAAASGVSDAWRLGAPLQVGEVVELEDHSRAYEHPDWLPRAAFLWAGAATKPPPSGDSRAPGGLDELVARLAERGHDVIGVDITTPEVERCGLRVVRAIVPGLQPLAFGQRVRLGGRRLYEAPARMGASAAADEAELNPAPHCFP
jgi:ribosomal protein S12 methylthiotransferase accessory factor